MFNVCGRGLHARDLLFQDVKKTGGGFRVAFYFDKMFPVVLSLNFYSLIDNSIYLAKDKKAL